MAEKLTANRIEAAIASPRPKGGKRLVLRDDREPNLRLQVGERAASWFATPRLKDGKRVSVTLGRWPAMGIADARRAAQDVRRLVDAGVNPNEQKREAAREARDRKSLRELLDLYHGASLAQLRRGEAAKRAIEQALAKALDRDPQTLTRRDIAEPVDRLALKSPISANRSLAYIKAFLTWAVGRGHIAANPAQGIAKPSAEVARDRTPSLPELIEIWQAAGELGFPFGPAVRLLIATAMRREEIGGMLIGEIDLTDAECAVFTLPVARSKNKRALRVPLSPLTRAVLVEAMADEKRPGDAQLIFTTTGESVISGWSKAKRRLDAIIVANRAKVAAETGVDPAPLEPWRLHDLRRSFATLACDVLHVDPAVCDRVLNHVAASTSTTVSRVYGRSEMFDQRKAALFAWGELLRQHIEGRPANVVPLRAGAA